MGKILCIPGFQYSCMSIMVLHKFSPTVLRSSRMILRSSTCPWGLAEVRRTTQQTECWVLQLHFNQRNLLKFGKILNLKMKTTTTKKHSWIPPVFIFVRHLLELSSLSSLFLILSGSGCGSLCIDFPHCILPKGRHGESLFVLLHGIHPPFF